MINVLVTCAGGYGKQNIIDSIRNNPDNEETKIITTDLRNSDMLKHQSDKFYQLTRACDSWGGKADPMWVDKLLDICKKESIDVILSSNEDECYLISKCIKMFNHNGTYACVNPPQSYEDTDYKHKTFVNLREKIAVPDFHVASDINDYESHNIKGTVCFKPSKRSSSGNARGFRIISEEVGLFESVMTQGLQHSISSQSARDFFRENNGKEPILLMEYLPYRKYTVSAFSHKGELKSASINEINVTESELAIDTNIAVDQNVIEGYCKEVCKLYNLEYCSIIEFKEDINHNPKFLEVNPRFGTSSALSWQGGLNHPYICIKKALGENFEKYIVPNGTSRVFRHWTELSLDQNHRPIEQV